MTEKQAYGYSVLRYIHDVVSGEALNIGVVMHCTDADVSSQPGRPRSRETPIAGA